MSIQKKITRKTFQMNTANKIINRMYMNSETADVHFTFKLRNGQTERVPAHKNVLAEGSAIFHKMFYGPLSESGDVQICDAVPVAFKEFLQFFYLNKFRLTRKHVAEVLYLTHKYDFRAGSSLCADFLKSILNADSMCSGYEMALLYDLSNLASFCEKEIAYDAREILKSASFKSCKKETLLKILPMNDLNCTELEIFDACVAWAQKRIEDTTSSEIMETPSKRILLDESNIGEQLRELIHLIRFPTMTEKEFSECLQRYPNILSNDEISDINSYISTRSPLIVAERFSVNSRVWTIGKHSPLSNLPCERFVFDSNPVDSFCEDDLQSVQDGFFTFSSSQRIILTGIGGERFETQHNLHDVSIKGKFEVWTKSDASLPEMDILLCQQIEQLTSGNIISIKFKEPVIINRGQTYEIRAEFSHIRRNVNLHAIIIERNKVVNLKDGTKIKFQTEDENADYEDCHLVSCIDFFPFY